MPTMSVVMFSVTMESSCKSPRPVSLAAARLDRSSVVYSAAIVSRFGSGWMTSFSIGMPSVPMIMTTFISGTRAATVEGTISGSGLPVGGSGGTGGGGVGGGGAAAAGAGLPTTGAGGAIDTGASGAWGTRGSGGAAVAAAGTGAAGAAGTANAATS